MLTATLITNLALENLALRQQLATLKSKFKVIKPSLWDKIFWCILMRIWSGWKDALCFVCPETVIRWHQQGFRLFWRWRSRPKSGRPTINHELRNLIKTMANANPTWGAPRIHGELQKLGFDVAQSTVARHMPRKNTLAPSQTWKTFITLHLRESVGIDFMAIRSATFRVLFGPIVIDHSSRKLLHVAATEHPTSEWTARQIIEAFPFDTAPRYLFVIGILSLARHSFEQ